MTYSLEATGGKKKESSGVDRRSKIKYIWRSAEGLEGSSAAPIYPVRLHFNWTEGLGFPLVVKLYEKL